MNIIIAMADNSLHERTRKYLQAHIKFSSSGRTDATDNDVLSTLYRDSG